MRWSDFADAVFQFLFLSGLWLFAVKLMVDHT